LAHCPYERLDDVEEVLDVIRGWEDIREPRPGVFYVRRTPFLHFHIKGDQRWADVRDGATWGDPIDLPLAAGRMIRRSFVSRVRERYERTLADGLRPRRRARG
jgi:hypothetical protein